MYSSILLFSISTLEQFIAKILLENSLNDDQMFINDQNTNATIFKPIRVLRALRILRAYRLLNLAGSQLHKQTITIGLTIMSLIICTAGIVQAVEYCDPVFSNPADCSSIGTLSYNLSFMETVVRNDSRKMLSFIE